MLYRYPLIVALQQCCISSFVALLSYYIDKLQYIYNFDIVCIIVAMLQCRVATQCYNVMLLQC